MQCTVEKYSATERQMLPLTATLERLVQVPYTFEV